MASKRDSKFMDAQNFIRELGYRAAKENEELQKHLAENGRDTQYYIRLGRIDMMIDVQQMAEDFVAGKYKVKYDGGVYGTAQVKSDSDSGEGREAPAEASGFEQTGAGGDRVPGTEESPAQERSSGL